MADNFKPAEIAQRLLAEHGYRRATDILCALVEAIDNDLCGLVVGDGQDVDLAEGSNEYAAAFDAVDTYRAYVQDDVHVRYDMGMIPEPLSAAQLGVGRVM